MSIIRMHPRSWAGARRRLSAPFPFALASGGAIFLLLITAVALIGLGCDDDSDHCFEPEEHEDHEAPAAPRGLASVTGDQWILLSWLSNTERDLAGYYVLVNDEPSGDYEIIATIDPCDDCDRETYTVENLDNGTTYYFAVIAFDEHGNESDFSEVVDDTPRPEGFDVTISNALIPGGSDTAGFDLSEEERTDVDDPDTDFWFEFAGDGSARLLFAGSHAFWPDDTARIQDMGWTSNFDEIDFAPPDAGWSPTNTAEAIAEHTYVLLTRSGHYAKIRLTAVEDGFITFDWGLQTARLNRQLIAPRNH